MPSKKNGSKNLFENMPVEPEEPSHEQPQPEAPHEAPSAPDVENTMEEQPKTADDESATDVILEDVRRSLLEEEEEHQKEAQTKWWKRIGRKSRKNTAPLETPKAVEEINLPNLEAMETAAETKPEPEQETDALDDLVDLLATEESTTDQGLVVHEEVPPTPEPEPEKVVDIEELKKQAFEPRPPSAQEENLTEVRSIALEGDEEVFVEVESTKQDALEERLQAVENAFKPYRRYVNFGLAFLGIVMAAIAAFVLINLYRQSVAANAPAPVVSNVPYPTSVSLPGGWLFKLGKGTLENGNWNPKGAEWLQGTEVCRWVALPWSRQLEAVIRTLNPDDPIKLGMSNNDTLTYKVYSIKQMSPVEMQDLDTNTPCLLVVLVQPDADKRWVLTSLP